MAKSTEYLNAMLRRVREYLPAGLYRELHLAALPSAGGAAAWRSPEVSPLEELALDSLTPAGLRKATDEVLLAAWAKLTNWHKQATRKKNDTTPFARFGGYLLQELRRRELDPGDGPLTLEAVEKSTLASRMDDLPDLVTLAKGLVWIEESAGVPAIDMEEISASQGSLTVEGSWNMLGAAMEAAGLPTGFMTKADPQPVDVLACCADEGAVPLYDLALVRSVQPEAPLGAGFWEIVEKADPGWDVKADGAEQHHMDVSKALCPVLCAQAEKRIIWYQVAVPGDADTYGHKITAEEIEDACHGYMGHQGVRYNHGKDISDAAKTVENYLMPCPIPVGGKFRGQDVTAEDGPIVEGTWLAAIQYDQKLWAKLKDLDHGISWGGYARKVNR